MAGVDGGNASVLQPLVYSRGSLKLLDQRKLPHNMVFLDIKNADDGWYASSS
jgi:methylthioribose-1-phosphate isomerase